MKLRISVLLVALFLGGCATTYFKNQVSAAVDPSLVGCCTFFIIPDNESVDTSSLVWRNFERQVAKALEQQGFRRATDSTKADIGIVASAGIGTPRAESFSVPVWGQTGSTVSSSSTSGTINTFGNTSTVNANTTYNSNPTYGVVGMRQGSRTVYDRWLLIRAYSMQEAPNGVYLEAWRTMVQSSGSTGDISVVAPYMLAASKEYFGKNLSAQKTVSILKDSKEVQMLIQ
jgi:hypothetical protein